MTTFDKREKAYEDMFARDSDLKFKAESRRNKALAEWAGGLLGLSGAALDDYIKDVRKVDAFTVDIETTAPFPILPDALGSWLIMSRAWCEKNNATGPVDVRKGKENAATLKAVGAGGEFRSPMALAVLSASSMSPRRKAIQP